MLNYESHEELERKEEALRQKVMVLPEHKRKAYFKILSKKLKDPDTYAVLVWFFFVGIHHLYLKKYFLFFLDVAIFLFCIIKVISLSGNFMLFAVYLVSRSLLGIPTLLASQRIVRQYNYQVSLDVYRDVDENLAKNKE